MNADNLKDRLEVWYEGLRGSQTDDVWEIRPDELTELVKSYVEYVIGDVDDWAAANPHYPVEEQSRSEMQAEQFKRAEEWPKL